ncbi:MAG: hypothetical protein ACI85O_000513 [Saprospiraceae bacterium]|jgi:hypothetical protein
MSSIKLLNIFRIFFATILIIIGIDKFFDLLQLCSLMKNISKQTVIIGGIIEIALGILVLLRIQLIPILYLTALMMGAGVVVHLINNTYDIGGAFLLMCYALGLVCFHESLTEKK